MDQFEEKVKSTIIKWSGENMSDKATHHSYDSFYPKLFNSLKNKESPSILEIGVYQGYSLVMWAEIFPNGKIYGWDNNYNRINADLTKYPNITLLPEADQISPRNIEYIKNNNLEFDVVIDDASHIPHLYLKSFELVKSYLKDDGMYIIEDIYPEHHCNLSEHYRNIFSFVDLSYIKNRGDDFLYVYYQSGKKH